VSWTEQDVTVSGLGLHVRRGGDGPAVVCLHGVGDDGTCFEAVAPELARDHEVVLPDARGHGRSAAAGPGAGYSTAEQVADLVGLLDALDLDRAVLLGHSMGALTALATAGLHPDRVVAVVLEDPPPRWSPRELPTPEEAETSRRAMLELKRATFEELTAALRRDSPDWPEDERRRWARAKQRFHPDVTRIFAGDPSVDVAAVAAGVRCPALLLTGDRHRGALVTPEAAEGLRELVPQLEVVHLPGTGHSIRRDDPDGYGAAVRGFLASIGRPDGTDRD
jgi:N-formylmaleamate deformylase